MERARLANEIMRERTNRSVSVVLVNQLWPDAPTDFDATWLAEVKTLSRGLPPTLLVAPNAERVTDEV